MPNEDDHYSGQSVWHSVLIFCCKGMIEGIMVVLFMWLLIQVLFTKNLEVHLQILLGVGLVGFCSSLILGCVLCWRRTRQKHADKEEMASVPPPPGNANDHVTLAISPSLSSEAISTKVQYEELEGDVLEYPSTFGSSTPSDDDFSAMPFTLRPCATPGLKEKPKSCFPLRRLSSPSLSSPLYRPMASGRTSVPSFSKLGLLSKKLHCTVSGDTQPNTESIHLTTPSPESVCALSSIQTQDQLTEKPSFPSYGANLCYANSDPNMHFILTFSSAQQTLTITLLSLTGIVHGLGGVMVQASLPPLYPGPLKVSDHRHSLSPDFQRKSLVLKVSSLEELHSSTLKLAVFIQEITAMQASLLGRLEVNCGRINWISDRPVTCTIPLR